ncbi:conserved Plasmodium protein, unknown function [Plasmodium yoelii]|uniref:Uncharacterized protein n=3 Tax=Plasmodium yoelii TaxID=5861 RepID=Q7REI0_PLAYO|nr:conserved Plasmodium protein, unknown function [Plasmodium yoelii]EAA17050.1 hypothetical protein [Plasmodium yoelii yoelii]CDU20036.1 conserved Plasmodium protein, unknown function [Plasmodium yoelii]VTZ80794.1 conserved Plasmodium protein, unknown function [Plasmodium yoelii]|eukprot:XP_725485.1 conserved Plasmodium protein, unknown function [Plasmodium yoelii]
MDIEQPVFVDNDKINANNICLQLNKWETSKEKCEELFKDKQIMTLKDYISKYDDEIKNKKNSNTSDNTIDNVKNVGMQDIVIICVIVNIPYQVRKYNNEKYIFWDVSDLVDTQTRIFLTGEICEQNEHVQEGAILALVNPFVKDKDPQYYNSRIIEIYDNKNLILIGSVDKLEKCKGRKRNGESCKIILYTPLFGNYCKYHIKQDKSKKRKKKNEQNENYQNRIIEREEANTVNCTDHISINENDTVCSDINNKEDKPNKKKIKKTTKNNNDTGINGEKNDESFDIDSIISMYENKIVVKDKKKKMELINNRIKELDDYSKLHNESIDIEMIKKENSLHMKDENGQRSINNIFSEQCPELLHLINRTTQKNKEEQDTNTNLKTQEEEIKENELSAINEEKQKKKFENFLTKLIQLQKSKDENDIKTLLKGLTYVTNNFYFNLKHVHNSNIFDICYKLMDHRSEEVAIAALRFKRKINRLYLDYYKTRLKRKSNLQSSVDQDYQVSKNS